MSSRKKQKFVWNIESKKIVKLQLQEKFTYLSTNSTIRQVNRSLIPMYQNLQKCDFTIIFGQEDTKVIRDT